MRAIAYLATGLAISLVLGLTGAPHPNPIADHAVLREVCNIALIVSVFGAGIAVERRVAASSWWLIGVLLVIGIPLTIVMIAAFAAPVMGLGLSAALLLGAVLAPTDPVLAGDLGLGAPSEEEVGEPRLSLHTEAGANDGLASPFVIGALLLASHGGHHWVLHWLAFGLLLHVAVAVLAGVVVGRLAALAVTWLRRRGAFGPDRPDGVPRARSLIDGLVLAVPFALYGLSELLHATGLVAVFVAGFAFRRAERDERLHAHVHWISEQGGRVTEFAAIVVIGLMFTWHGIGVPGAGGWLLAPVVIVLIRPLLVLLLALRTPLRLGERLYLGFFGVRGVAAVYYAAVVAGSGALGSHDTEVVVWTTLACVAVSIVVHGVTAAPLTRRWLGEG